MKKSLIALAVARSMPAPMLAEPLHYRSIQAYRPLTPIRPDNNEHWRKPGKRKAPKQK